MLQLSGFTSDPIQTFDLQIPGGSLCSLKIRFNPRISFWFMDITYKNTVIKGLKICSNLNLLQQWANILPFGILCMTTNDTEPIQITDFLEGRTYLMLVESKDLDVFNEFYSGGEIDVD